MSELLDAIENFDEARARRLLEGGVDPNVRGYGGITPLHLAVDSEAEDALYRYDTGGDVTPPDGRLVGCFWLMELMLKPKMIRGKRRWTGLGRGITRRR